MRQRPATELRVWAAVKGHTANAVVAVERAEVEVAWAREPFSLSLLIPPDILQGL